MITSWPRRIWTAFSAGICRWRWGRNDRDGSSDYKNVYAMGMTDYLNALRVVRAAPASDRKKVSAVLQMFRSLDREVRRFKSATGLQCVPGCGHCCENPNVEATVLEVLPLAVELWRRNEAEDWLRKLSSSSVPGICIFYQREIHPSAPGHCRVYPFRPLICRMFGFAAITDKYGKNSLVACTLIKNQNPQRYDTTVQKISRGLRLPRMADYSRRAQGIDLSLAQQHVLVNEAITAALERVGFLLECQKRKSSG